jgi:hypothetical protein
VEEPPEIDLETTSAHNPLLKRRKTQKIQQKKKISLSEIQKLKLKNLSILRQK